MRQWVLVMVLLVVTAGVAYAESRSLHVEWGYTPPTDPAVTGFRLYQEGAAVHTWDGEDVREGDATVDLTATITTFTLTATFADDTESPHSAPFAFNQYLDTGIVISWGKWMWFSKPGYKHTRVGGTGLKGARMR